MDSRPEQADHTAARPVVSVRDLRKVFTREDRVRVPAIDGISLDVRSGELMVLLGPSGCGKTTLLRCIAGLESADDGTIELRGRTAFDRAAGIDLPPEQRDLSMIFQSYALWPHMTVHQNVAFPLRSRHVAKATVGRRVRDTLEMVGVGDLGGQYPGQLSGGQQQRVALARALVSNDELVLFDEPLSNVDAKVREQLRYELVAMQRSIGFAAVYVTHDQTEAMELAHRIAVMRAGRVEQIGSPRQIYELPTSHYVANFIGTANSITGTVTPDGTGSIVVTPIGPIYSHHPATEAGTDADAVWRPEWSVLHTEEPVSAPNRWKGTIEAVLYAGTHMEHILRVDSVRIRARTNPRDVLEEGSTTWLTVDPSDVRVVPAAHD